MGDGDVFGEMALLEDVPRSATIVTCTPCLMLTLSRQPFEEILAAAPHLRTAFEQMAATRQREVEPSRRLPT
jgi:CRP-like cAMP-binding protein